MNFLTYFFAFLSLLGTLLFFVVLLSSSEAGNLDIAMLSVFSVRSQCSTKVARSPFSGLKPCEIIMALCVLGALFASKSTV